MKPRKMHNRMPVWVVLLLFAVLFLSACAGDGKTAAKRRDSKSGSLAATLTPTPSPTSTPSPTPTPMREPEDYDVAELYKAVDGIPNMYELPIAEYMKGREFEDLKVSGNYVLAYYFPRGSDGITDYMRPCCVLFHLGRPDLTRTYESSKNWKRRTNSAMRAGLSRARRRGFSGRTRRTERSRHLTRSPGKKRRSILCNPSISRQSPSFRTPWTACGIFRDTTRMGCG